MGLLSQADIRSCTAAMLVSMAEVMPHEDVHAQLLPLVRHMAADTSFHLRVVRYIPELKYTCNYWT